MIVEKKKLSELNRAAYNPRVELKQGDAVYEQLKRSINEFGYVEPIVWNKTTGNIVGGHQRLTVLEDMGYDEVDVVVIEVDELKEKTLNLALNKVKGEWDFGSLSDLLQEMQDVDYDFTVTGFTEREVASLIGEAAGEFEIENNEEEAEAEEAEEPDEVKVRIAFFNFTLKRYEWENIIGQIRYDVGFEKENIINELKRRLFESAV